MKNIIAFIFLLSLTFSCKKTDEEADAYGNFEATEIMVSAATSGKILELNIEEGNTLKTGEVVGYIDTAQLFLRKEQLLASKKSIATRKGNVSSQADVLQAQLENLFKERKRVENLLKDKAAAPKQLDDINAQIAVVRRQIASTETQNPSISAEIKSMNAQIEQIEDQINKSIIRNPINGTVLTKYANENEITTTGKPIYKIADLDNMVLRVYISGNQLPEIKIRQKVNLIVGGAEEENTKVFEGEISWIASSAEFTPKIIQTKEERVNLVYAVKVRVKNKDGLLKIGMPGEVKFK